VKALVTGSAGFVGRHIVRELLKRGWGVTSYDVANGAMHDAHFLFAAGASERFDLIVHCAFNVGGRAAIDSDRTALAKNLLLDAAMFDWAVRTGQTRILYFSSSAVYPTFLQRRSHFNVPPVGYRLREGDTSGNEIGRPDADYGYAKMVGEQLAVNAREMGVNVHVVRPFSGFAEDQSLDYPFPSIVKRARAGDLTVWGPEGQTRDWLHISDLVAGALAVVDQDYQEPVNLCTGVGTEMGELAVMVNRLSGGNALMDEVEYLTEMPTGVFNRVGDPTIFHTIYTPKISIEEGVRRALA
jgi:nucleoside-diphosphate-sugar epimerase